MFSFQQFEKFKCLKLNEKSWRLSDRVNKQSESTVCTGFSQQALSVFVLLSTADMLDCHDCSQVAETRF